MQKKQKTRFSTANIRNGMRYLLLFNINANINFCQEKGDYFKKALIFSIVLIVYSTYAVANA